MENINKSRNIKLFFKTEKGLEFFLISDLEQKINQLILQTPSFRDFYSKSILLKINNLNSTLPGFVSLDIKFIKTSNEYIANDSSDVNSNIRLFISNVIYKLLTPLSIIWVLNEINYDQIFLRSSNDCNNLSKVKLDSHRLKEEIDFSIKIFQIYQAKAYFNVKKFSNISIYTKNKPINESMQSQLNDIALKQLSDQDFICERGISPTSNFDPIFQIIINDKNCWICCNLLIKSFNNIISYNKLIIHNTPIAPQTVNVMSNIMGEIIIQFLKETNKRGDSFKYNQIIFLDPFCGYGTIPLCLYSNSDLLKSLIKVSIEKINIFGMDMDASCIEKCVSNLNLIKDYIPDTQDHFQKSIQINFQTSSIQNIIEKIPFKISIPVIISIITQPPYGLTIKKSESELEEIYLNLLYLASKLSQHNKIFLCFISIYSEKLIEKINKFQHQMSNNSLSLNKIIKISKHENEYAIYFMS